MVSDTLALLIYKLVNVFKGDLKIWQKKIARFLEVGRRCLFFFMEDSINIFLVKGGEAGAAAPKGSMTYAFTYEEFSSLSIHLSIHLSGHKASF